LGLEGFWEGNWEPFSPNNFKGPRIGKKGLPKVKVFFDNTEAWIKAQIEGLSTVVVSTQHAPEVEQEQLRKDIIKEVIEPVIGKELLADDVVYHINPTGRFVIGGPQGDAGLTGRKIIVDTYGGSCPHGGGAFSGKDPTKVDRSGAYAARYVAKNLVAAGVSSRVTVQIAYAIGVVEPVSIMVDTHGEGDFDSKQLENCVKELFDLRPAGIIKELDLLRPIYKKTAAYGHFGRELDEFTWEKTDKINEIKSYLGLKN